MSKQRLLLRFYDALVASRLNYGAEFYATASKTSLLPLDTVHNSALRIITGARQSSPVLSLEVEANRPPLHLQRTKLVLDYVNRFRSLPENFKVVTELQVDLEAQFT